jgi:hypothetical protein
MRRLLQAAGQALLHPFTQPFSPLWLGLIQQIMSLEPQHTGAAALMLPLRLGADAAAAPATVTSASAAAGAAGQGVSTGEQPAGAAAGAQAQVLLETWRLVGSWLASADVKGGAHVPRGVHCEYRD